MITFLLAMAIIAVFGVFLASGRNPAGSGDAVDRDAQRVRAELNAILGRACDHR